MVIHTYIHMKNHLSLITNGQALSLYQSRLAVAGLLLLLGLGGWLGLPEKPAPAKTPPPRPVVAVETLPAMGPGRPPAETEEDLPPPLETPAFRPQKMEELPPSEQASLHQAIFTAMHAVEPLTEAEAALPQNEGVSHLATHPGQKFHASFLKDGSVRLGNSLPGKTWQGTLRLVDRPYTPYGAYTAHTPWQTTGTRAEREAAPGLTEWYENRAEGLEHGFTVAARPAGAGESGFSLDVALEGLRAEAVPQADDGQADAEQAGRLRPLPSSGDLVFSDPATNQPVLAYRHLKVWDATGKELAAAMRPTAIGLRFSVRDEDAVYPVTIDPLVVSLEAKLGGQTKLTPASDPGVRNWFGFSVALDGDTAFIGAPVDRVEPQDPGSVYVFVRDSSGGWTQWQKLNALDATAGDMFGYSVAMDGNTAVIGAKWASTTTLNSPGYAYVFGRDSGGTWTQQGKLLASDGAPGDEFGSSVAIDGDTILVGSPYDDDAGQSSGSVYVFVRNGSVWSVEEKMTANDAEALDNFGRSVALDGNAALVGADNMSSGSGVAYVFTRGSNGTWSDPEKLTAPDPTFNNLFGCSVALEGDTALIGASGKDNVDRAPGAVYVFTRGGGTWTEFEPQKLTVSGSGLGGGTTVVGFGVSVALSGDTAFIGEAINSGAAYLFARSSSGTWTEKAKLTAFSGNNYGFSVALNGDTALIGAFGGIGMNVNGEAYLFDSVSSALPLLPDDHFGLHVDLDGDVAVVGALDHDTTGATSAGAAWAMRRTGTTWRAERRLTRPLPAAHDRFGVSVGVSGNLIAVGADYDDEDGKTDCGSVTIFEYANNIWTRRYSFVGPSNGSQLGRSVAIDGRYVAAGAPGAGGGSGLVVAWWLYQPFPDLWEALPAAITSLFPQAGANFGFSVALSRGKLIVGAPGYDYPIPGTTTTLPNSGLIAFYNVYQLFAPPAGFFTIPGAHQGLGFSVAMDGSAAVTGNTSPPGWFTGATAGAVGTAYVFTHNGTAWSNGPAAQLSHSGLTASHHFGSSVAVSGNVIAVGAFGNGTRLGGVRLFQRQGAQWVSDLGDNHTAPVGDRGNNDCFGISTALSGDTLLVGAYGVNTEIGAAYVYRVTDPNAVVPVLTITRNGVNAVLTWPAGTGLALWQSPTMANGSWTKVAGSESQTTQSVPVSGAPRLFFRLAAP